MRICLLSKNTLKSQTASTNWQVSSKEVPQGRAGADVFLSRNSEKNNNKLAISQAASRCRAAWAEPTPELISQSREPSARALPAPTEEERVRPRRGARPCPRRPASDGRRKKKQKKSSSDLRAAGDSHAEIFGWSGSAMTTSVCVFPLKAETLQLDAGLLC